MNGLLQTVPGDTIDGFVLTKEHGIPMLVACTVYVTNQGCLLRVDFPGMDDMKCYEWGVNFFKSERVALLALSITSKRLYDTMNGGHRDGDS